MNRIFFSLSIGFASALSFVPMTAEAQYYGGPGYGHMFGNGGWHGWFFGPMMMIVFIAVTVVVVVLLSRWLGGPGHGKGHGHAAPGKERSPLDILQTRFARGEIDEVEYRERRRVLEE
jgi:putative membrane protein